MLMLTSPTGATSRLLGVVARIDVALLTPRSTFAYFFSCNLGGQIQCAHGILHQNQKCP